MHQITTANLSSHFAARMVFGKKQNPGWKCDFVNPESLFVYGATWIRYFGCGIFYFLSTTNYSLHVHLHRPTKLSSRMRFCFMFPCERCLNQTKLRKYFILCLETKGVTFSHKSLARKRHSQTVIQNFLYNKIPQPYPIVIDGQQVSSRNERFSRFLNMWCHLLPRTYAICYQIPDVPKGAAYFQATGTNGECKRKMLLVPKELLPRWKCKASRQPPSCPTHADSPVHCRSAKQYRRHNPRPNLYSLGKILPHHPKYSEEHFKTTWKQP